MTRLLVEISLEELAYLSIALDNAVGRDHRLMQPEHTRLREKWDKMYRSVHGARELGIRLMEETSR